MNLGLDLGAPAIAKWARDQLAGETGVRIARWMSGRRWFGDKSRPVERLLVHDLIVSRWRDVWFLWPVMDVVFADGGAHSYTLPLALVPANQASEQAFSRWPDGSWALVDAVQVEAFPAWLLEQLRRGNALNAENGTLAFTAGSDLDEAATRAAGVPARAGGLEQSNTLIRYGDVLVVKLFRRLQTGINVDAEMGQFLYEQAGFRSIPAPLGEITWQAASGQSVAVAFSQAFVPNLGDGWGWTLTELAEALSRNSRDPESGPIVDAFAVLGRRTAEMHRALASRPDLPDFAPEPVTDAEANAMAAILAGFLSSTVSLMRERRSKLTSASANLVDRFLEFVPELESRVTGFANGAGAPRIRVHGDYHLGQTLRTPDGDWSLIDFEGEPARPLAERRAKNAALKDVAGMTRSIGYARAVAARNAAVESGSAADFALAGWEASARSAFLRGYREQINQDSIALVPRDDAAFAAGLAAWELDKGLYEIRYELGNRPDWLDVPILGLLEPAR